MDTQRKLIVGFDLCEDFSQISCYSYKTFEPVPICSEEDSEESCLIPSVLCIRKDTKLWLYGKEANACAMAGDGILIDHILTKIKNNEVVEILEQKFSGVNLLEKFFRKTLTEIKNYFPTEQVTKIVVTLRETDPVIVDGIYEALYQLGIEKDRAEVISHAGAYLYYALSQDRSLWMNDVGLFDFGEDGLTYYQININRRSVPMIAGLTKKDYNDTLSCDMLKQKKLDISYIFENVAGNALYKQLISTLYFTGKGFEGDWATQAIKNICAGKRAFVGQNLYTKGACYAAKELSGDVKLDNIILLNDDMLTSSIAIRVYCDAKQKEIPLTDAAVAWYEVNRSIEVIPDEEAELELIIRNIMTKEVIKERLIIQNMPERPNRMTRLQINLTCLSTDNIKIGITDLGFGDIYTGTGYLCEYTLDIG
ncbi:MAG TPA: DUF5716 family protein [Mobilitalea sp.]|nr:DUF5716 family protein [Mobilitalea sp.]